MFKNPPDRGPATSADSDIELSDQLPEDYLNLMERSMQDCDGQTTGVDPAACHSVGEFLSIVRDNHEEAAKQYRRNCDTSGYAPESLLLLLLLQLHARVLLLLPLQLLPLLLPRPPRYYTNSLSGTRHRASTSAACSSAGKASSGPTRTRSRASRRRAATATRRAATTWRSCSWAGR